MGASILSVFLLALLLSDSIICGRAPQTEHAENVDPAAASSNHGRTFLNFDSSPAQTHLEFNGGFSSNLHRDGGHGGNSGVFPHPGPGDTGSVPGDYDYATYDQSNYPQWHKVHLASSEHDGNAAQPVWSALGQQQPMATHLPHVVNPTVANRQTIDLSEFHPTHSFFGSMFTKGSPNAGARGTTPPVATENRPGSRVDTTSKTTSGEAERTTVPTSVVPGVHGNRDNKALQNGAPLATSSRVLPTVGIAATATTGSPPTLGNIAEASTPGVRPVPAESILQTTSSPIGATTTQHAAEPRTETHFTKGSVTSAAVSATSGTTSYSTGAAPAATDIVLRQAVAETVVPPPEHSGAVVNLPTPPARANQVIETTTGHSFANVATGGPPVHLQTTASVTETTATRPVRNTPSDNASPKTDSSTLPVITKQPSKLTSPVDVVPRNVSQDLTTTQGTTTLPAVPKVAGLSGRVETTTNSPPTTSTLIDGVSKNRTTEASTRAPVDEKNSIPPRVDVESSAVVTTSPVVTAGVRRLHTSASPTTPPPEITLPTTTVVQGAEETPAKNAALQQTLPPPRPASPVTTSRPPVTPDAYFSPMTQHGPHEFVPQRHRDVEDYYYHSYQKGFIEDDDLRQGQCGRCQRRLHYCVQKCFTHHSCEAEANPELTCPRINAPCLPPYKHEVDQCRHSNECESANHLCCLVGCARRCVHGVPIQKQH
ncbi:uncharacterized protein LOC119163573 [Rhipicephalus microplus]|uniref:uncharacterized protein LOC119163573 n=1 Tax=Rhipicephalus microplus TaxID=6941 RepID=UPI0023766718